GRQARPVTPDGVTGRAVGPDVRGSGPRFGVWSWPLRQREALAGIDRAPARDPQPEVRVPPGPLVLDRGDGSRDRGRRAGRPGTAGGREDEAVVVGGQGPVGDQRQPEADPV